MRVPITRLIGAMLASSIAATLLTIGMTTSWNHSNTNSAIGTPFKRLQGTLSSRMRRLRQRATASEVAPRLVRSDAEESPTWLPTSAPSPLHSPTLDSPAKESPTWLPTSAPSPLQSPDSPAKCTDSSPACAQWAASFQCEENADYMLSECRRSCGVCGAARSPPTSRWANCADTSSFCGEWAAVGECDSNPNYMRANCRVTCALCQSEACHDVEVEACKQHAHDGLCKTQPQRMFNECKWACGWCAMTRDEVFSNYDASSLMLTLPYVFPHT